MTFEGGNIFIGRQSELDFLERAVQDTLARKGGLVLIEGGLGAGKSTLVEELCTHLSRSQYAVDLSSVLTGHCYAGGEATPYFPFIDGLSQFVTQGGKRSVSKLALDLIKRVGPDLLRLIPVLGEAAATTFDVAREFWLRSTANEELGLAGNMALQFTETITALAEEQGPLVLVLEDVHWGDSASAQLLVRIAQRVDKLPLLILATYRPDSIRANKAFSAARTEIVVSGTGTLMPLLPFSGHEINSFLAQSYGSEVAAVLTGWIVDISGGQPLFVAKYLNLLERNGALRLDSGSGWYLHAKIADLPIPDSVGAILDDRMGRLSPDESRLLQHCSVQGHHFYARVAADVEQMDEMSVIDILQAIAEREGLVALRTAESWAGDWTDTYSFCDQLSRQILYSKMTARQKQILHYKIGKLLLQYIESSTYVPSRALIEAAEHLVLGQLRDVAAQLFLDAANAAFEIGAFNDATQLAKKAVSALSLPLSQLTPEAHLLRAKGIQLQLLSSEMRWWGIDTSDNRGDSPYDLLEVAEMDAQAAGDLQLRAQLTFLKAKITIIRKNLHEALAIFEQALLQAEEAGDKLGEVVALIELGHDTVGVSHSKGLGILQLALAKWQANSNVFEESVSPGTLARHFHRLQGSLGIAEFDGGNFDVSENLLRRALDGLRHRRMFDLFSLMSNFLAQLYIAEGRFEEAEKVLYETLDVLHSEADAVVHKGYNLALLGKLYLEWGKIDKAAEALIPAFESTQVSGNEPVLPLIRNYYCELLLHPDYPSRDISTAENLLKLTLKETAESGFVRSEVTARMLLARLYLGSGAPDFAVLYSQEAASTLELQGILPAVRSEEVWFVQGVCLRAQGNEAAAQKFFIRARDSIGKKAGSISDAARKYQYLERVPLNKSILAAAMEPR